LQQILAFDEQPSAILEFSLLRETHLPVSLQKVLQDSLLQFLGAAVVLTR